MNLYKQINILKLKQLFLQLMIGNTHKLAYTQHDIGEMFEFLEYQGKLEDVEEELMKLVRENEDEFSNIEEAKKEMQKFIIKNEEQREISKEVLGISVTVDELLDIIDKD